MSRSLLLERFAAKVFERTGHHLEDFLSSGLKIRYYSTLSILFPKYRITCLPDGVKYQFEYVDGILVEVDEKEFWKFLATLRPVKNELNIVRDLMANDHLIFRAEYEINEMKFHMWNVVLMLSLVRGEVTFFKLLSGLIQIHPSCQVLADPITVVQLSKI